MTTLPTIPWSQTVNYPAGIDAWDGTATQTDPAYRYMTPDTPVSAQEMNAVLAERDAFAICAVANTWAPRVFPDGSATYDTVDAKPAWDSVSARWIVALRIAGTGVFQLYTGAGTQGIGWVPFGISVTPGVLVRITSVAKDPTNANIAMAAALYTASGHVVVYKIDRLAGTSTAILVDNSQTWTDCQLAYVGGTLVVGLSETGTPNNAYLISTPNNSAFGTAVPGSATKWAFGVSPTVGFIAIGLSSGSPGNPTEITSPDGLTFSTQVPGFSGQISGNATGLDIAWDGIAWYFMHTRTDLANVTHWLRSEDGLIWTTCAGSLAAANWSPYVMAGMPAMLTVVAVDNLGSYLRILVSNDNAATWQITPFEETSALYFASSNRQLILNLGNNVRLSGAVGNSLVNAN